MATPSTRKVLFEKYSRYTAAENFFIGFLDDHEIKLSHEEPNSVFYIKNDIIFMEHDKKTGCLWVLQDGLRLIFREKYKYSHDETKQLIICLVWKYLKLKDIILNYVCFSWQIKAWKNVKLQNIKPISYIKN
jgi:hypothetical protein